MVTSDQIFGRPRTECAVTSILTEPATAPVNWYTSVIAHIQRLKTYRDCTYRNDKARGRSAAPSPPSMIYFSVTALPAKAEFPFRGQGNPTAALRRKRVNWCNDDALWHRVRRHTEPDDDGYQREQNSVYSRNLLSRASSESHAEQLRKHLPPAGHVVAMELTEKQYVDRKVLVNTSPSNNRDDHSPGTQLFLEF